MMRQIVLLGFLGFWIGCSSSGGTETDNPASPLKRFGSSGCKTKVAEPGQQALVLASDAQGLQCVEWEPTATGTLALRLLNFPEPCGEMYIGKATTRGDNAIDVSVHKDVCDILRCGTCVFDFDFELSVPLDAPLQLRIGAAACESQPPLFKDELTLPLDVQASGIVCRALESGALAWDARARGSCGQRNMPCGDCDTEGATTCAAGLVCTELWASDKRCLQTCRHDRECAGGLTRCEEGVCAPAKTF